MRYTLALLKQKIDSDFLQFHRIEPTLVTSRWQGRKILYIHNDIYQEVKGEKRQGGILWRRFPWAYFAIERFLVPQFYQIFSCNSDSAQLYRERYPEVADRVSYLSNTVDGDLFYALSPQEREAGRKRFAQKLNLPEATRFILFAGRLHPQKDPLLLLQSFAAVQEPNVHLLIVGEGELENDIRAEIDRLNLTNQVTLLGPLKQAELADLYRICSIFVLTSVYEGLARGSIEALACGTPVVTTRAGETPKFLSHTQGGIVCEERTSTVIANALKEVLVHPENYPSEACVHIAQPFDAQSVVSGIYSELLERWKHETHETLKIEVSA
ncbi:glycosyltransferase family 4 protein [Microcoleus sp. FACHB-1515]|uniref:glycosyltransferase family 4 protein n=1 Tax=Cyanophyceae TaxID=3028117 RepID=UPI0028C47E7D|nr:glycosyltransferase family 4 protein [Microcoleus sp. FACHB-1515]